ncbi:MAG: hypothetical protein GY790_00590 [Bacteroidetes bacterium]|nr:hypothetical protein [Bacteroidota bacterium]
MKLNSTSILIIALLNGMTLLESCTSSVEEKACDYPITPVRLLLLSLQPLQVCSIDSWLCPGKPGFR